MLGKRGPSMASRPVAAAALRAKLLRPLHPAMPDVWASGADGVAEDLVASLDEGIEQIVRFADLWRSVVPPEAAGLNPDVFIPLLRRVHGDRDVTVEGEQIILSLRVDTEAPIAFSAVGAIPLPQRGEVPSDTTLQKLLPWFAYKRWASAEEVLCSLAFHRFILNKLSR